jgi:hypothetical protein
MRMTTNEVEAAWAFAHGQSLPVWQLRAANDAMDSGNPIHDDSAARARGFRGGLVPGVTLYGYLTHPLIALFGQEFLCRGGMEVRFRRPVYAGERVEVHVQVTEVEPGQVSFALELRDAARERCVVGTATLPATGDFADPAPAETPLPASRRPATPEILQAHPDFGSLHQSLPRARHAEFLRGLGEDLATYRDIVHPAWLLRQANYLIDRNLALGPWIHVGSTIRHLGLLAPDENVAIHGRVRALYVRKNADCVDVDVLVTGAKPIMRVLHRAIYRMP